MALIRNIAGFGMGTVQDFETLKCADPGCTNTGAGGSWTLDDNGPYVYQQVPGSGIFPAVEEMPVEPIVQTNNADTTRTDDVTPPANVVTIRPVTSETPQNNSTDTVGLLILAAMGVLLMQRPGKSMIYPLGLYMGGVGALYYHLKK